MGLRAHKCWRLNWGPGLPVPRSVIFSLLRVGPGEEPWLHRSLSWTFVHLGLRYTQRTSCNYYLMMMKPMIRVKLYQVPSVRQVLSTWHVLIHFVLRTILPGGHYYHPHSIDGETKVLRVKQLVQGHPAAKWKTQATGSRAHTPNFCALLLLRPTDDG